MKKDKQAKDLKELNDKLKMQNELTEMRYYSLEQKNKRLEQENKQLKEKLDKVNKKINQYEIITGYYDSNYDGVEDTYSHDIKNELLKILGDGNNE